MGIELASTTRSKDYRPGRLILPTREVVKQPRSHYAVGIGLE